MNTEHPISAPVEKKKLLVSFLDSEHKERFFNLVEANTDGAGDLTGSAGKRKQNHRKQVSFSEAYDLVQKGGMG